MMAISPHSSTRTTDVTGIINLPEGTDMVMPGDTTDITAEIIQPIMEKGLGFAIREGMYSWFRSCCQKLSNNFIST